MSEELKDKDIVKKEIVEFLKIRDKEGNTLLHYVVKSDNKELAKQLIAAGCDVNAQNKCGDSSLPIAVHNNQLKTVEILFDAKADFYTNKFMWKQGPLYRAAKLGDKDIVQLLVEQEADENYGRQVCKEEDIVKKEIAEFLKIRDKEGNTLLHYVVKSDNVEFTKQLIEAGCDVDARNKIKITPLVEAVRKNQLKMTTVLLDAGADFQNDHYMWKKGPLYYAVMHGYPDIVQLLVDRGADVKARYRYRETALHVVSVIFDEECGEDQSDDYCKIMKILINSGANPNATDEYCRTPILNAVRCGFTKGFDLLLSRGADVRVEGEFDYRVLFGAVQSSNFQIFTKIVELGYDVNMTDDEGLNCIHHAASLASSEIVEFLLSKGAAINFDTVVGDALCYALDYWWEDYKNFGETSDDRDLEIEESENHEIYIRHIKCFNLFIKYGANLNHVTNDGDTPLYIILSNCEYMHSNFLRTLLKNGATLDFDYSLVQEIFNDLERSIYPHLMLRHVAMFEAQNRKDGPKNFDLNKLNEKWQEDYAFCRDELESMKETKIEDTNVPFINILANRDIGPYTRNKCIRSAFETLSAVSKHFPIYGDLLYERFTEAMESEELVKEATDGLGYVLNWDTDTAHLVLSDIICYLDKQDLMNLAKI